MLVHKDEGSNSCFEEFLKGWNDHQKRYYASELQEALGLTHMSLLEDSVKRAMRACQNQHLPLEEHFKAIYRCRPEGIMLDWKLSGLAYRLVLLNADPASPLAARMQLALINRVGS